MNTFNQHIDEVSVKIVAKGFLGSPLGRKTVKGVIRRYFDGSPTVFLSDAQIAEEVETLRLAEEAKKARQAAEAHDAKVAAEAAEAMRIRILQANDRFNPGSAEKARKGRLAAADKLVKIAQTREQLAVQEKDAHELMADSQLMLP